MEYRHVKDRIFIELSHLGETIENSLVQSIWNFDIEQMEATLIGINKVSTVSGIKVTDKDGKIFTSNGEISNEEVSSYEKINKGVFGKGIVYEIYYKKENKTLFEYKFPVYSSTTNEEDSIGYTHIYSSQSTVIERVKYGFVLIIVNSLIKTSALWVIFLYFAKKIVAKPLSILDEAAKGLNPEDSESFINNDKLEKIFYSGNDDEIHSLSRSFIKMRSAINGKIEVIEEQNATLEQRVKERTATIEEVNKELKHLSLHDPLTGLPNRVLFHDRLEHLLHMAVRENFTFAIASVDLRKFKEINDTFGHQAGDFVLKELSKRISNVIRSVDTVARMGGDEFAILLKDISNKDVRTIGEKIISCTYDPIIFENESVFSGLNVGFSFYPEHGENPEELFKNADLAMYKAKKNDDGLSIYTPEVSRELQRREIINQDLEHAIAKNQIDLFYQPIIETKEGNRRVNSLEALIRWKHPDLGYIPPGEFISVAERSNIIKALTNWVFKRALRDGNNLYERGYNINISVNLSGKLGPVHTN